MEIAEDIQENPMIGRRIGVYELKRELGRGGMGAVYLAERADGEFHQTVAVKLIKRGMDTDLILKRFRRERQILAALNHPNIAYFLGGGSTPDGLPYFVMEYIEGAPLYRFCDENKLGINEKLRLFRQICYAVHAAHQIKVIHRDLKPSNILVKENGKPKLLDFGIAKVLDPELSVTEIEPTATQMRVLTPEYASPEQVCGDEVTPASDIYSLGVMLYELLTGHRPYYLKRQLPTEVSRVICEEEPIHPSSLIVRSLSEINQPLSKSESEKSNKGKTETIEGDLEKIILKTLRKSAPERYQSAEDLAEDITNFLENREVKAEYFAPVSKSVTIEQSGNRSIAILPFSIISTSNTGDTDDAYLSIGLADALTMRLSNIRRFIVRPTSSVVNFAGNTDSFVSGRELGVEYVVEGNIRRVGDRIRVTAQLLDIKNNSTRWAEKFDEKFTDVLEFEDLISERVAKSLITSLSGEELKQIKKRGTDNVEAYESYLRGRYYWNQFSAEGFARALACYNRAVEIAPDYALAYAGIADYYNFLGVYAIKSFAETSAASKKAALKAISIDDSLAEAYAALGFAAQMGDYDWDAAGSYFQRAIELNPNYVIGRVWYCYYLVMRGEYDEAFKQVYRAMELDPHTPIVPQTLNWALYYARRYDEAVASSVRFIEQNPNYGLGYIFLCSVYCHGEQYDKALKMGERGMKLLGRSSYTLCWLASVYAAAGEREKAFSLLDEIRQMSATQYVSPYLLAMAHLNLGDKEKAFAQLNEALKIRDGRLNWLGVDPQFDSLHDDPRFQEILLQTNNPLYKPLVSNKKAGVPVVAVLPLKSISYGNNEDTGDRFLGFGLADAVITRLTNIKRIIVRPTSSVTHYAETDFDPFRAGSELDVDYVLDGNFRRSGERIRVSMQLLNIKDNTAQWAEVFDEKSTDVLELEDSISERVVKSLVTSLTGEERKILSKRGTKNAEAYETYLRGRYYWNQFTPDSLPKALTAFEKAIELDPNYALAYVGLADFYNWAIIYGILPPDEFYRKAENAALRAIELDKDLGEAYASLALIKESLWDFEEAEQLYKKAIELNPNYSLAHEWYSSLMMETGRIEEGLEKIKYAESLNPLSTRAMTLTAWQLYQAQQFEEAIEKARQIIDLDANYPQGYLQLGNALSHVGKAEEAVIHAQKCTEIMLDSALPKYSLCFALVAAGRRGEAREVLREMKELAARNYVKPYFLAMGHVALEEYDEAFKYFEQMFAERDPWITWFGTEPKLAVLRKDPRFIKLFRRTGNPFAFQQTESEEAKNTSAEKSIAVLPLKLFNSSQNGGKSDDDYLRVGLADAIVTRLSNVRRFIVRPTSSSLLFGKEEVDPFDAGRSLAVEYVVDGNLRRVNGRIRVTIQLLDVSKNSTCWSQSFDEKNTDVLELEDSISAKVAESLIPQLTGEEQNQLARRGTNNVDAYEAYLRGRYHLNLFTPDNFIIAKNYLESAIRLDQNYALAYSSIADCYFCMGTFASMPPLKSYELSRQMAERAIELEASLGEAYAILGFVTFSRDYDFQKAEVLLKRSIQLSPHYSIGRVWLSVLLTMQGRSEEAVSEAKKAVELNPISPFERQHYAWILYHARKFDDAIAQSKRTLETEPNFSHALGVYSWILRAIGENEESIVKARRAVEYSNGTPWLKTNLAASLAKAGQTEKAREILRDIADNDSEFYVSPFCLAIVYFNLGEIDKGFAQLEEAFATRDVWLIWLNSDSQLDGLRSDARFQDLEKRMLKT